MYQAPSFFRVDLLQAERPGLEWSENVCLVFGRTLLIGLMGTSRSLVCAVFMDRNVRIIMSVVSKPLRQREVKKPRRGFGEGERGV